MNWLAALCVIGASLLVSAPRDMVDASLLFDSGAASNYVRSHTRQQRGNTRFDRQAASAAIFFTAKLEECARAFEAVPWVAAASVRRVGRTGSCDPARNRASMWSDGRCCPTRPAVRCPICRSGDVTGHWLSSTAPKMFARGQCAGITVGRRALRRWSLGVSGVEISSVLLAMTRMQVNFQLGRDEPAGRLSERIVFASSSLHRA